MNTNFNPQKIMRKIKIDFNCKDLDRKMQSARKYFNTGFSADFEFDLTRLNFPLDDLKNDEITKKREK